MDGLFELRVSKKNAVLKFTYIGFKPSEVRINSSTNIYDVVLEEQVKRTGRNCDCRLRYTT